VQQVSGVRNLQRVGDLDADRHDALGRQRRDGGEPIERRPFQVLQDDEVAAILLADIVDGTDIRVVQPRGGAGFTLQPLDRLRIPGDLIGQQLDCDEPPEARVLGLVDDAHTAASERLEHEIMREPLADHAAGPGVPRPAQQAAAVRGEGIRHSRRARPDVTVATELAGRR
jgi:hypothetical protein